MNKRLLFDLSKYLLAVGLLVWVIRSNWAPPPAAGESESHGLGYVWERHAVQGEPIHVGFLAAGFGLYVAAVLLTLFRWHILVRALDLPLTQWEAVRLGFVGIFFNTFLPGAVGGDVIKAAALARTQSRRTAAVATVIMDRIIALWALVWFVALLGGLFWATGMLSGPAATTASFIVAVAAAVVAVSGAVWLLMGLLPDARADRFAGRLTRLPVVGHSAAEFWRSLWMYRRRGRAVMAVMALSWVGQVGFVVSFWCCARALWDAPLGPIPTLSEHFLLVPLGMVMQAVIPTPGGAGGGEWGYAALYMAFHGAGANGVLASLVQRAMGWALGLVGCGVHAWLGPAPAAAEATPGAPILSTGGVRSASRSALAG